MEPAQTIGKFRAWLLRQKKEDLVDWHIELLDEAAEMRCRLDDVNSDLLFRTEPMGHA